MYQDPTSEWLADNGKVPFRLARYNTPPRTARMKQVLKKLGLTPEAYSDYYDEPLSAFLRQNPEWTQRAWEVELLENLRGLRKEPIPRLAIPKKRPSRSKKVI